MEKTAIVTGASRGIGAAAALALPRRGAVWPCAAAPGGTVPKAWRLVSALRAARRQYSVQMSLTKRRCARCLRQVEQTLGPADILVNNAGVAQQKLFTDITAAEWDAMFGVCVKGAFHCCQAALPHMIRQKWGPHHQYFFHVGAGGGLLRGALFRGKGGAYRLYQGIGQGGRPKRNNGKLCGAGRSGNGYDGCFLPGG